MVVWMSARVVITLNYTSFPLRLATMFASSCLIFMSTNLPSSKFSQTKYCFHISTRTPLESLWSLLLPNILTVNWHQLSWQKSGVKDVDWKPTCLQVFTTTLGNVMAAKETTLVKTLRHNLSWRHTFTPLCRRQNVHCDFHWKYGYKVSFIWNG